MSQPADIPPVIQRWLRVVDDADTTELDAILDEDAVFYSPAVFTPQRGRELTAAYLRAAARMFAGTDFHYVEKWFGPQSAVLAFCATVDGLSVEGIDMIHWNEQDRIVSVKVMIRPFKALQTVIGTMASMLAGP
ncbi:MAG: nuclear transport factor 2 family protein [Mycobacterium sp.]